MTSGLLRWYPHVFLGSLCAGLAAANLVRPGWPLAVTAAMAALAALGAAEPAWRVPLLAAALLATGWWWGGARLDGLDASVLLPRVGETARAVAIVTGPPRHGAYVLRMPAEVRRFAGKSVREPVLLVLPLGRSPPQGAVLELIGRLNLPRTSASGFDERRWLRRQGIAVVLDGLLWRQVGRRGGLGGLADRLRSHIERTMAPTVRGERRAVLAGVVLGADEGLSRDLQDAFRAAGLYHLLAVSGQNIVFIAIGVLAAAWLVRIPRWLGEVGVLTAIGGYTLAVGWQPSVVRAGVAGAVASLAWLAARPRDRWYALLLGAMVLLPRLQRTLEGYPVPRKLGLLVVVATVCSAATAPILWLSFGAIPVYSIPANAMAELSVGPMLGLGLVAAALHPVLPGAAAALGWAAGVLAAYLAFCARLWASLPGAQITAVRGLLAAGLVLAAPVTIIAAWPRLSSRRI